MDNYWRRKLRQKKFSFYQYLPYGVLFILLVVSIAIIRAEFKTSLPLLNCAASSPGEVVRCTQNPAANSIIDYHDVIFRRLLKEGYLSLTSKSMCMLDQDVNALKRIGISNVLRVSLLPSGSFERTSQYLKHPLKNESFDFEYFGSSIRFNWLVNPSKIAREIGRTLKVGGYLVIHIVLNDKYSYNSFITLFTCCRVITSRPIRGLDNSMPSMQEIVFIKDINDDQKSPKCEKYDDIRELIQKLEPLVTFEQPTTWDGPWGSEDAKLQYLPSMVDLSFNERYVYVDVGANSFNSSIGSWFLKDYPKQNKPFEIFAIEANTNLHEEYKKLEGRVTLLPYAAWVRNETLTFNVYEEPTSVTHTYFDKLGRISDELVKIEDKVFKQYKVEAFDFVDWLLRTVTKRDFVVMKIDVEGAEGALLNKLKESGAMCLINELFLECHYDRSYENTNKYNMNFEGCLNLFKQLRREGFFVHQWW